MDAKEVEEARVPLVVGDQQLVGKMSRDLLDVGLDARRRREGQGLAGLDVDAVGLPVLVAAVLPEENDVATAGQPDQPGGEVAVGHPGERPRLGDVGERADPEVQPTVEGRQEGEATSVRAQAHDRSVGAGKQHATGDEPDGRQRRRRAGMAKQSARAGGGAEQELATGRPLEAHAGEPVRSISSTAANVSTKLSSSLSPIGVERHPRPVTEISTPCSSRRRTMRCKRSVSSGVVRVLR